jgi:hypothetical protein
VSIKIEQKKGGSKMFKKSVVICLSVVFLFTLTGEALSWWWDKESKKESNQKVQKIIFSCDDISYSSWNRKTCKNKCNCEDINDYLSSGWRIVTATKEDKKFKTNFDQDGASLGETTEFGYAHLGDFKEIEAMHRCICKGKEYVIEK